MTGNRSPATPRRMCAVLIRVIAVGLLFAGVLSVPVTHAQQASALARVETLDLDTAKRGAPQDLNHPEC